MIIAIHQPNYIPWPGYFYKIMKADIFVFLDDVQFSKNSFINRSYIRENDKNSWITLPVKTKNNMNINQVLIADEQWKMKHLSKIKNAYLNKENFQYIWEKLSNLYLDINSMKLSEVNIFLITKLCEWMELNVKFYTSSKLDIDKNLRGDERLIEIIKCLNGKEYLSGLGAKNYQQDEKFRNANLENKNLFSETSILDPIFNEGISNTVANLKAYNV